MFVLSLSLLLAASLSFAQTFTASISGIVSDSSGAVVAGVSIKVTNTATNTTFRSTSNESGFYVVNELPPGTYSITAEQAGFRTYALDSFPLSTQQKASLNIALEVGQISERVQVTGEAQLVESTSSTLGAVVENKRILDLPLNGRNIFNLAALVPGVFMVRQVTGIADTFTANRFIVNGGQESTSDIMLDGVTATVSHNISTIPAISAIPSVEGIQEFKIQTNAYSAEYGRSGGGLVTLVTKSGTNDFHGSVYEFHRNSFFDANNFFANRAGRPLASFKRNQFGASGGGPVLIPKLYNGKNRTFFFFNYEGQRILAASLAQHTLPTELERAGNFTQSFNSAGQMKVIYDPFSTRPDPARPGRFLRDPFAGNIIPQNRIDPVALAAQKYYPAPNSPGLPFTRQNNFVTQAAILQPQDRYEWKIDHVFDEKQRMFLRYTLMDSMYSKPNFWGNIVDPGCCDPMLQRLQNGAVDYTRTISNASVLNLRYGYGRVRGNRYPWSKGFQVSSIGLPAAIDGISNQPVFPTITIQDYTQLGPNGGDVYLMADQTHSLIANLSHVRGRHSMKFGFDGRFNFVNYGQLGTPSGGFNFDRQMTQGPDPRTPTAIGGIGYASFLLGTGSSGSISHQIRPANANRYFAFYLQDDFKVARKLTINAGLRWDFESGATERYDQLSAIDPLVRNPISDKVGFDVNGGIIFAPTTLGRRTIRNTDPRQINPRLGLVYELNSKTVIRAGYGIFFGLPSYAANSNYTGGAFNSSTPWLTSLDGITPNDLLKSPFPNGFNLAPGRSQGLLTQLGQGLGGGWPDTLQPVYNQQWNLNIQRSLGRNMVFEIAYAGNKGTHLPFTSYQINQLSAQQLTRGNDLLSLVPNPFYGFVSVGTLAQPTVQLGQLLRPFPEFTGGTATNPAWGNSNYHALQTRFERRFADGFSLLASYTWSKTMSDGPDGFWNNNGAQILRDWNCRRCDYSISSYDQPHRFVTNVTYELPLGKGKKFGSGMGPVLNAIAGQWQVNGILTISQGQPLRFATPQNTSYSFGGGQTPDVNGNDPRISNHTIDRWFDTSVFSQPKDFTFGNMARSISSLRNPGARVLDFSVFKEFHFKERAHIELRGEAFNFTNTPLFGNPGTTINTPTFGVVTSQENAPRQVQLGLKIYF